MNQKELYLEMNQMLRKAAMDLDADTIIDAMTQGLVTILALATVKTSADPVESVEVLRHRVDIHFTHYLEMYRNAKRTIA